MGVRDSSDLLPFSVSLLSREISYHNFLFTFYSQATVALNNYVSNGTPPPPCCGYLELNTDARSDFVSTMFYFYPNPLPNQIIDSEGEHLS